MRQNPHWVWLLGAALFGCASDPWRGCTLCLQSSRLPGLQRQADLRAPLLASAPHCAPMETIGLPDEPESVDDLDAILDTGRTCGPDGHAHAVPACPALAERRFQVLSGPKPSGSAPWCGEAAAACPNQNVLITAKGGDPLLLEFYDDPSSHRAGPLTTCTDGSKLGTCYYRLGGVSQALRL